MRAVSRASGQALPFNGGTGPVPIALAKSGIPLISAPTGTMANNGAVTLGTALAQIYANCYLYLPAGSIAAGVPAAAGWLFAQMSSTTVGVVFNNTFSGTAPVTVPASPTAFVTTGPGAFTGDTTEQGVLVTVPAGSMGTNGSWHAQFMFGNNNSVGTKTARMRWSGISGGQLSAVADTTVIGALLEGIEQNRGVAASQIGWGTSLNPSGTLAVTENSVASVNTAATSTIAFTGQKGTATDWWMIDYFQAFILTDGT